MFITAVCVLFFLIALFSFLFVCFLLACFVVVVVVVSCAFPPPNHFSQGKNLMLGKIKCVTFCCVTQTKQTCELSVRNYRFEILQRIQKRRLIGENCFEVQIRQNHFISECS